jgi:hypothetical protein
MTSHLKKSILHDLKQIRILAFELDMNFSRRAYRRTHVKNYEYACWEETSPGAYDIGIAHSLIYVYDVLNSVPGI